MKFAIAIEEGTPKTAYGVAVPDIPGCYSAGDTLDEAYDNAVEAIKEHLAITAEEGGELPNPKGISAWRDEPEYKGWVWGIVDVPVEGLFGPAEKINITVPAVLLRRIDQYTAKTHQTRSGFMTEAAMEKVNVHVHSLDPDEINVASMDQATDVSRRGIQKVQAGVARKKR